MRILIVDDDPQIRAVLEIALERAGYDVIAARDGAAGLRRALRDAPDLVVLDVGLPEMDGLEVCRRLRAKSEVPVLFLTARDDEIDRVLGLEMGADDYVTKPFSPRELVARIKAILKRSGAQALPALRRGDLELDAARHLCLVAGQEVALTATEAGLLGHLLARGDQVVGRVALVDAIWGAAVAVSDRTLDSHLRNLRAKLAGAGLAQAIETVHGVGLRMAACRRG
ncbi:MAG: response regulator transcription factor [Cypionkella sp.]